MEYAVLWFFTTEYVKWVTILVCLNKAPSVKIIISTIWNLFVPMNISYHKIYSSHKRDDMDVIQISSGGYSIKMFDTELSCSMDQNSWHRWLKDHCLELPVSSSISGLPLISFLTIYFLTFKLEVQSFKLRSRSK